MTDPDPDPTQTPPRFIPCRDNSWLDGKGVEMPTQTPPPDAALPGVEAALHTLQREIGTHPDKEALDALGVVWEYAKSTAALTARVRELETPPLDAALPAGIEAEQGAEALKRLAAKAKCDQAAVDIFAPGKPSETWWIYEKISTHIAALTAQNAALVAERDAQRGSRLYSISPDGSVRLADEEGIATRARIEALEWVTWLATATDSFGAPSRMDGVMEKAIEAELARLQAQGEAPSDE